MMWFAGFFVWGIFFGLVALLALRAIDRPRPLCQCGIPIGDCENARLFHAELDDMKSQHREYTA